MKVAFSGPSGSGKTTLVKWVADEFKLRWVSGSSGDLKRPEDREFLKNQFGYTGNNGHAEVIRASHNNPELGLAIQRIIQQRRFELLMNNEDIVTDRSPIDNWVYYMLQCGLYQKDVVNKNFRDLCIISLQEVSHLIIIPFMFDQVEDNKSRLVATHYQKMISTLFLQTWNDFDNYEPLPKTLIVSNLDLDKRKEEITNFLNNV